MTISALIVARNEEKRIEKETAHNLSKSYCYVMANDMFNKLGSAEFYQKQQLNNYHKLAHKDSQNS